MKKIFLVIILTSTIASFSQEKNDFWENVRFGGGITLAFNNQTTIGVSPSAIYQFNNGFSLGAGATYMYSKFENSTRNLYGGSIISLYQIPATSFQISGEYEHLFANQSNNSTSTNFNFPALYLGAAYNQGSFAIGLRYDLLFDKNKSVFASAFSPIVRFFF